MLSLFTEASRDAEAEATDRRRELINAKLDNGGALRLIAHVKSQEEYGHYKAFIREAIQSIADRYESTIEEVEAILDQKASYLIEANQLKFEQLKGEIEKEAFEGERFAIIDGAGRRVGGTYHSREAAQEAILKGHVKSTSGLRIVPTSAVPRRASKDPFSVLAGFKTALQEGVDPLEWIRGLDGGEPSGEPSEHNEGPKKSTAANENPNSPITDLRSVDPSGGPADIGGQMTPPGTKTVNPAITTDPDSRATNTDLTSSPIMDTTTEPKLSSVDPRRAALVSEISHYNPDMPKERIEIIANRVMKRFYDQEDVQGD